MLIVLHMIDNTSLSRKAIIDYVRTKSRLDGHKV